MAHPDNNTAYIDRAYQYLCLIAKTRSIRENLIERSDEPQIYDFSLYQLVLNTGFDSEEFYEVQEMDFEGFLNWIEKYYE